MKIHYINAAMLLHSHEILPSLYCAIEEWPGMTPKTSNDPVAQLNIIILNGLLLYWMLQKLGSITEAIWPIICN